MTNQLVGARQLMLWPMTLSSDPEREPRGPVLSRPEWVSLMGPSTAPSMLPEIVASMLPVWKASLAHLEGWLQACRAELTSTSPSWRCMRCTKLRHRPSPHTESHTSAPSSHNLYMDHAKDVRGWK